MTDFVLCRAFGLCAAKDIKEKESNFGWRFLSSFALLRMNKCTKERDAAHSVLNNSSRFSNSSVTL